jgi:8-oxo-dGTP pyrophosphatase MutT (NUDIX family)
MSWQPHLTVACIVEHQGKFLFVEEYAHDRLVLNQPAGHLEANETLTEATIRETLEETGYHICVEGLVGYYSHTSPVTGESYYRMCYFGSLLSENANTNLDPDIVRVLWLSADEFRTQAAEVRTPMVNICFDDYLAGKRFSLDFIHEIP